MSDWHLRSVKVQMLAQQHEFVFIEPYFATRNDFRSFRYVVDKWLSPTQGDQQLFVELSREKPRSPSPPRTEDAPPSKYIITIQTGEGSPVDTTDSIEMIIRGVDGQMAKMLLKDHVQVNDNPLFQRGALDEFEIEHADIGQVGLIQ